MRSDDVVAAGLRLLWQLDTFLAKLDANRLDETSNAERTALYDAFMAAATTLTAVRQSTRPAQKKARQADGHRVGPRSGPDVGDKSMSRDWGVTMTPEVPPCL